MWGTDTGRGVKDNSTKSVKELSPLQPQILELQEGALVIKY